MFKKCVFLLVLVLVKSDFSSLQPPKVVLSHGGIVVGSHMTAISGKSILAYRGIPYAEPPTGELRFEAPKPVKAWQGEILTNQDSSVCIQINPYERNFTPYGDEDCLYLNVYAPQRDNSSILLPVMVYLHGGGWVTGTGNSNLNGPQRLLDHDIILVIGNYRLGALGFLSTGTLDCPGNNGFKDQLLMLKWVKDNIKSFGGSPDDVTLFGESAGSVSVAYHMYAEASEGLFHKAIMQSGSIFNSWAVIDSLVASNRASKLGQLMNCTLKENNWGEMVKCLKDTPATDTVLSLKSYFEFDTDPVIIFAGVVELNHEGAFLKMHPKDIDTPPSIHVPIIVGGTAEEGAIKSGYILNVLGDEFKQKYNEIFPIWTGYKNLSSNSLMELIHRIDEFYFNNNHNWSKENYQNLTNFISDQRFNFGMDKFLRKRFASAKTALVGSTYVYLFDHRGPKSATELFFHGGPEYYGVCHTDDLPYIFYNDFSRLEGDKNDKIMKLALPRLWANFARIGNPTPDGSDLPNWLPADDFPIQYARLGSQISENWTLLKNERGLMEERIQFWRKLENDFHI